MAFYFELFKSSAKMLLPRIKIVFKCLYLFATGGRGVLRRLALVLDRQKIKYLYLLTCLEMYKTCVCVTDLFLLR